MISGIFRSTIWHQTIPDEKRGRLAGIEMLSYSVGPLGGQARAGLVADRTSVRASIVSGGVLCVIGVGVTAAWLRDFWRYDAQTDEHAVRERTLRADRAARRPDSDARLATREPGVSRALARRGQSCRKPPRNRRNTPPSRGSGAAGGGAVARGSRPACRSRCARSRR